MVIMVSTTTIRVRRPNAENENIQDPDGDGYDTPTDTPDAYDTVHTAVRATIIPSSGRTGGPGETEFAQFQLACDPIDLRHTDLVDDETTGDTYAIDWTHNNPGVANLGHTQAGLSKVTGPGGGTP